MSTLALVLICRFFLALNRLDKKLKAAEQYFFAHFEQIVWRSLISVWLVLALIQLAERFSK